MPNRALCCIRARSVSPVSVIFIWLLIIQWREVFGSSQSMQTSLFLVERLHCSSILKLRPYFTKFSINKLVRNFQYLEYFFICWFLTVWSLPILNYINDFLTIYFYIFFIVEKIRNSATKFFVQSFLGVFKIKEIIHTSTAKVVKVFADKNFGTFPNW